MADKPRSWSAPLSRRAMLGTAGAAGAAMILGTKPNPAASAPKISQQAVAYQGHPTATSAVIDVSSFNHPMPAKWLMARLARRDPAASSCRVIAEARSVA